MNPLHTMFLTVGREQSSISERMTDNSIRILVFNSNNYPLKKKTIRVRGLLRLELNAAAKVLAFLSDVVEELGKIPLRARVELVNIRDSGLFSKLVKTYSPIPIEIIYYKEEEKVVA